MKSGDRLDLWLAVVALVAIPLVATLLAPGYN
jgi:hypothetical protein